MIPLGLDRLEEILARAADIRVTVVGDIRHSRLDVRQAADGLGWRASVGLEEGLRRTLGAMSRREAS